MDIMLAKYIKIGIHNGTLCKSNNGKTRHTDRELE